MVLNMQKLFNVRETSVGIETRNSCREAFVAADGFGVITAESIEFQGEKRKLEANEGRKIQDEVNNVIVKINRLGSMLRPYVQISIQRRFGLKEFQVIDNINLIFIGIYGCLLERI